MMFVKHLQILFYHGLISFVCFYLRLNFKMKTIEVLSKQLSKMLVILRSNIKYSY